MGIYDSPFYSVEVGFAPDAGVGAGLIEDFDDLEM